MQNEILIPTAMIPLSIKIDSITSFNLVKNKDKWIDTDEGKEYIKKQSMANQRLAIAKQIAKTANISKQTDGLTNEQLLKKQKDKEYRQGLRLQAIKLMGGQCSVCLIDDHDVLELPFIKVGQQKKVPDTHECAHTLRTLCVHARLRTGGVHAPEGGASGAAGSL